MTSTTRGLTLLRPLAAAAAFVICASLVILCPTPAMASDDSFVSGFAPGSFAAGAPTDADSLRIRAILANTNKYALTTWWTHMYASQRTPYLTFDGTGEVNIRPGASEAFALAAALSTGSYDAATTGVSEATALTRTTRLIGSLARSHAVNTRGGWGNDWQTPYWAALVGTAGWELWGSLSATDQTYVRKMVESEANALIGYRVPYWKDTAGALMGSCGDTKAEENAWSAQLLLLAPVMMPQHSRRSGWAYKGAELAIGAYASPPDLSSSEDILGRPLKDWLDGTNVGADGTLINHDFYHPDYVTTNTQTLTAGLIQSLAHQPTSKGVLHNSDLEYSSLAGHNFWPAPAPPCPGSPLFVDPGSTNAGGIDYVAGSSDIYYPEGSDWGSDRRMHFADVDVLAGAFGFDNLVTTKAATWEPLHAQRVLDMQGRSDDGRTYQAAGEDTYSGREEWVAREAATAWLAKWAVSKQAISVGNPLQQICIDDRDRSVSVVGAWKTGTPAVNGTQVFGPTSRYKASGSGTGYVRFTPRMSQTRAYKVYAWWNAAPTQATNAPYTVHHATGTTVVIRNQRVSGGSWNLLGTFTFGPDSYVQLGDKANGFVVADGILLDPS